MREQLGDRLPAFSSSDFALLREAEPDFYGMNYYTAQFARHRGGPALAADYIGNVKESQVNRKGDSIGGASGIHWLRSCPEKFRKHLTRVYRLYGKPIYITENGCPCPGEDSMTCEDAVNDMYRVRYFDDHLRAVSTSITQDGADIRGYFAWSLLDNMGELTERSEASQ